MVLDFSPIIKRFSYANFSVCHRVRQMGLKQRYEELNYNKTKN